MTDAATLKPGEEYTVAEIQDEFYVVVDELRGSPEGGLYWTEFEKAK
jgi:hypothetical protein